MFEVVFEKACASMDWSYLDYVLRMMDFPLKRMSWMS